MIGCREVDYGVFSASLMAEASRYELGASEVDRLRWLPPDAESAMAAPASATPHLAVATLGRAQPRRTSGAASGHARRNDAAS
jgi:hypothetical protein